MALKLGINIGYSGARLQIPFDLIQEADRRRVDALWTAEAWGSDAVTPLAWAGALTQQIQLGTAIMQMPARTPANTAMTAMTLDALSGGRFLCGLGASGPQVVEGWHGLRYGSILKRTREYVSILRKIFAREETLEHQGETYQIPYRGQGSSGLGKPLRSILHARPDLPIYLAAIGPKNVDLAAEIADGWLPIFFSPSHYEEVFRPAVDAGLARRSTRLNPSLEIVPTAMAAVGDDVDACRDRVRPTLALYIGGMGAPGRNFYFNLAVRYGYQDEAVQIQELFLAGKKKQAAATVPDSLVDEVALCGPVERIRDGLQIWKQSPVTMLNLGFSDPASMLAVASLVLADREVEKSEIRSTKS